MRSACVTTFRLSVCVCSIGVLFESMLVVLRRLDIRESDREREKG
jgi:hypothetical protein